MNGRGPADPGETGRLPTAPGAGSRAATVYTPQPESYDRDEVDLRDIWLRLKRRRRTIGITAAVIVILVAGWTLLTTPVWSTNTLIRVEDKESGLLATPALTALTGLGGSGSQIETELRILRTRPIAEDVVDRLDLNVVVDDPEEVPRDLLFDMLDFGRATVEDEFEIRAIGSGRYRIVSTNDDTPPTRLEFAAGDRVELPGGSFVLADLAGRSNRAGEPLPMRIDLRTVPFQQAVKDLLDNMSASRPDADANVLQVGYRTSDRTLAYRVPNTLAASFIERRKGLNKQDARSTVAFIQAQVDTTHMQLRAVEDSLRRFQEDEQIVAVEAQATAEIERLAALQTRRMQLQAERSALARLLDDIDDGAEKPDYRRLASFPTFFQNQAVATMLSSLVQADSAHGALLARLTPSHPDVITVEGRIAELEGQLGSIGRNYLQSLDNQIAALDDELATFNAALAGVPQQQITFARIARQVDMLGELYKTLQTRLKEAQVQEAIDDSSVRIVEEAIEPLEPASPRPVRNMALAVVVGLMLGLVLALGREYTDRRLHATDSLESAFGLSTMARIPSGPSAARRDGRRLTALHDAQSVSAESYRTLRTNVGLIRRDREGRSILLTSPSTGEGKSATAANLAVTLARAGSKTLLVDADMRRPSQHGPFDVTQTPGLSEYLLGREALEAVIRPTALEELAVLPAGGQPGNPAELLGGARMAEALKTFRSRFDAVVLDGPPVLAVTDSAVLAPKTDGVILVVRAEKTDKNALALAIQQLRQVEAEILGAVVTDADAESSYQASYAEYFGGREPSGLASLVARIRGVFT